MRSVTLLISNDTFAYCLLTVLTLAFNTKLDPVPIDVGATVIEKSALYPVPPSVTVISVTALPATTIFALSPVPVPPDKGWSKYCPFVNPDPPFAIITSSINPP